MPARSDYISDVLFSPVAFQTILHVDESTCRNLGLLKFYDQVDLKEQQGHTFSIEKCLFVLFQSTHGFNPADWWPVVSWVKRYIHYSRELNLFSPDSFVAICIVGNIL